MKNILKVIFFIIVVTNISYSQNFIDMNIDEIIVSSNRAKSGDNITNVHVIQKEEIENAPVQTIEDLLEYAINVDVRQRGRQGVQSDVSIRGGTFEQVLVMLNGIKLNDTQTGHHTMDLPVSLEQIERIEIITGGASRIFGNYAYTGAINIITKSEMDNSVILSTGENSFKSVGVNYHQATGPLKHNLSLNHKKSDGYITGMDYKISNYYYQSKMQIDDVSALLNIGYTDKEFGAFSFYTPAYPDQFEKTKTTFASLQFKRKGFVTLENKMYWRKHTDEFILFRDDPDLYHNFHETNIFGLDMNAIQKTKSGTNVVGMEIRTDNIISSVLGEDLDTPIIIDSNNAYYKGADRTITNLFAEKNFILNQFLVSAGIMMNIDSEYGNEFFPGIDMVYDFSSNLKLFASYNKSMRTPNYTELYYSSPTNQGNVNLKSEYSVNREISLKFDGYFHRTNFTYYKREGKNMIDWVLLNGDSIWRTQNLSQVNTSGFEISSHIDINKFLGNFLSIYSLSVNYSVNNSDTVSEGFQSAYVLDHLHSKLSLIMAQKLSNKLRVDWRVSHQDREGDYIDFQSGNEIDYEPFWLVAARATFSIFNNSSIFLEVNNILDNQYIDFGNIPQPGRWARFGVKFNM